MPRAIALLRVSSDSQAAADRGGLPRQREVIERVAAREGLELVEWVELEGVSGAAVLRDPRFVALLRRLSDPDVDGVVVAEFSRLMRPEDPADYAILGAFRSAGKLLWTPDGARDVRRFGDRLISLLQGELVAEERRSIRERTWGAKELHRRAGRHVAGPQSLPTAVTYTSERRADGTVRPVWGYAWPAAATVRDLYERFALRGEVSLARLASDLGYSGAKTARGILRNPIYKGVRRIGARKVGGREVARAPEDVIEVPVIDPPLVSPELWERAQALLESRPRRLRRTGPEWTYSGLTRCAACGAAVHAVLLSHWGPMYRCTTSTRAGGGGCATGSLVARAVNAAGDEAVMEGLGSAERLAGLLEAALSEEAAGDREAAERDAAEKRLGALAKERSRVLLAYERGLRALPEAQARLADLTREEGRLRALAHARPPTSNVDPERIAVQIASVFASWRRLGYEEKRRLLAPAVRGLAVERTGRAKARVPQLDLWLPALSPTGGVHGRGPFATRWVRLELAA